MKSGNITVKQGDLVILEIKFSDFRNSKLRPALIVSSDKYNYRFNDVVVLGLYSKISERPYSLLISNNDLKKGFLIKTSLIKVDSIFKVGTLKDSKLKEIKELLYTLFE